jgi:Invasion associated locus B (IalB) protein
MKEDGKKVCYMLSNPVKQEGNVKKRGQAYAMITHRPGAKSFNVVSFHAGYAFAPSAVVDIKIGKDSYQLFTEKDSAWTNNETDGAIVNSIKKGETIIVKGKSAKGTETTDTYSLKGSTQAYQAINKACGL